VTVIINTQPEGKGPLGKTNQTGEDITTDLKKNMKQCVIEFI
jgi:hypothetical protein